MTQFSFEVEGKTVTLTVEVSGAVDLEAATIAPEFAEELAKVDPDASFQCLIHPEYDENEWSVDGWTVYGGTSTACEHGVSEAMHRMGFRFFTPEHAVYPDALAPVQLPRQQFDIPYLEIFLNYGSGTTDGNAKFQRWLTLNAANDKRLPNGHSWPNIISEIEKEDGFFSANPQFCFGLGTTSATFNLDAPLQIVLAERVAQHMLGRLNEHDRAAFDPQDGSQWPSDKVFGFVNAVTAKMRETNPKASLGTYAYAKHREPPSFPIPDTYVNYSVGFSSLGLGHPEAVRRWGEVTKQLGLRTYGMIAAWNPWHPFFGKTNAFADYPGFVDSGVNSIRMESTANFLTGLLLHYHMIRIARDVSTPHEDVLQDVVEHLFDGDSAAEALLRYWSDPINKNNAFTQARSFKLIDALRDGPLKDDLRNFMAWSVHHFHKVDIKDTFTPEHVEALERSLNWAQALDDRGTVHGWAYLRRYANSYVINGGFPDLHWKADPEWAKNPTPPTAGDYQDMKALVDSKTKRPPELDDTTLVLAEVTPTFKNYPDKLAARDFNLIESDGAFAFVGPGLVTVGGVVKEYGHGLHHIYVPRGNTLVSFEVGLLFLNNFPDVRMDPSPTKGARFIYVPEGLDELKLWGSSRITVWDAPGIEGRHDLFASGGDVAPGHVTVDNTNTRGIHHNHNCNPWISAHPYVTLMPKALAEREGLAVLREFGG